jgi:hypothetical protein
MVPGRSNGRSNGCFKIHWLGGCSTETFKKVIVSWQIFRGVKSFSRGKKPIRPKRGDGLLTTDYGTTGLLTIDHRPRTTDCGLAVL